MSISFADMNKPKDPTRILIVDGLNLAFRYKHSKIRDFGAHYIGTIESLAKSYNCGKILVVCDKGSSEYRKAIHPGYKSARKEKYENQTEQEKQEAAEFFEDFELAMSEVAEKYPLARFPGVEADDLAAYAVCNTKFSHYWLASSDKDWDLLISPDVSRFSYVTRKEVTFDNFQETYGIDPESYITYKCLTGDSGDSVPGVVGIGEKRAAALIKDYGDIDSILKSLPINSKYKHIQALNSSVELLAKNRKLMDLELYCEEAIGIHLDSYKEILNGIGN